MSISSTGLYGSATIVNTDLFDDVQALKEEVTTLSTSYLTTTAEHRADISQNRFNITDLSNNRIVKIEQDIFDISTNKIPAIIDDINDISTNKIPAIIDDINDISDNVFDISTNKIPAIINDIYIRIHIYVYR